MLLLPLQDEKEFTSLKVSALQNNHEESPKRDRAPVLKILGFFQTAPALWCFSTG